MLKTFLFPFKINAAQMLPLNKTFKIPFAVCLWLYLYFIQPGHFPSPLFYNSINAVFVPAARPQKAIQILAPYRTYPLLSSRFACKKLQPLCRVRC